MYFVDTNIFLEILLEQAKKTEHQCHVSMNLRNLFTSIRPFQDHIHRPEPGSFLRVVVPRAACGRSLLPPPV